MKCKGRKKNGERCSYNSKDGLNGYCKIHAPQSIPVPRADDASGVSSPKIPFTVGLYYPWIDIRDEGWLKTTVLYWDTIKTIVPEGHDTPYESRLTQELSGEGILQPEIVQPRRRVLDELVPEVVAFLNSDDAEQIIFRGQRGRHRMHSGKFGERLARMVRIHPMKLHHEIEYMLHELDLAHRRGDDWLDVDTGFADYYMTLLATHLSQDIGAGLLTDLAPSHRLGISSRLGSPGSMLVPGDFDPRYRRRWNARQAQGIVVDVFLENLTISPQTSLKKILKFRRDHATELARFRKKVAELAERMPANAPLKAMRQHAQDAYATELAPAIDDMKNALASHRIKWLSGSLLKLAFLSIGSSSTLAGLGLAVPNALLVGAGISMLATSAMYAIDRRREIADNPYLFLLKSQRQFGT